MQHFTPANSNQHKTRYTTHEQELLAVAITRYTMAFVTFILAFKSVIRRRGRFDYVRTVRHTDPTELHVRLKGE